MVIGRHIRVLILVFILVLEIGGALLLFWALPFSEIAKTAIIAPVVMVVLGLSGSYLLPNMGYVSIDNMCDRCKPLPKIENVPEIHRWEASFILRNPMPWEATIYKCNIIDNEPLIGTEVTLDEFEIEGTKVAARKTAQIKIRFVPKPREDSCHSTVRLLFELEYSIGGGRRLTDKYYCLLSL